MWQVELTQQTPNNWSHFPPHYFPRQFKYKKDTERQVRDVKLLGGDAIVKKVKR